MHSCEARCWPGCPGKGQGGCARSGGHDPTCGGSQLRAQRLCPVPGLSGRLHPGQLFTPYCPAWCAAGGPVSSAQLHAQQHAHFVVAGLVHTIQSAGSLPHRTCQLISVAWIRHLRSGYGYLDITMQASGPRIWHTGFMKFTARLNQSIIGLNGGGPVLSFATRGHGRALKWQAFRARTLLCAPDHWLCG